MKRRDLLKFGAGVTAFLFAGPSAAQSKRSKKSVEYQSKPKGKQRCDNCALFQKPFKCKSVKGSVSPQGWCNIWVKA